MLHLLPGEVPPLRLSIQYFDSRHCCNVISSRFLPHRDPPVESSKMRRIGRAGMHGKGISSFPSWRRAGTRIGRSAGCTVELVGLSDMSWRKSYVTRHGQM